MDPGLTDRIVVVTGANGRQLFLPTTRFKEMTSRYPEDSPC